MEFYFSNYHVLVTPYEAVVEFIVAEGDDILFHGGIKWDGCSNWDFSTDDGTTHPLHFCGKGDAKNFGQLLDKLYEVAAELMPNNDLS